MSANEQVGMGWGVGKGEGERFERSQTATERAAECIARLQADKGALIVEMAEMTKQLVAPKAQADLMEAMLGAVCQAQIQQVAGEHSSELARGLDAALAFFRTFLCRDDVASPHNSDSSASMLLCATMATVRRAPGCDAHGQERAGDLEAAYGLQFTRRPDLLHECCTWNNGKAFQRLEYLGDAFLQCTPPPRPWLNTHDVVALTQSC